MGHAVRPGHPGNVDVASIDDDSHAPTRRRAWRQPSGSQPVIGLTPSSSRGEGSLRPDDLGGLVVHRCRQLDVDDVGERRAAPRRTTRPRRRRRPPPAAARRRERRTARRRHRTRRSSSASVCQRNVSPSSDKKLGLPPASARSSADSAAASGSARASARPRIVARTKSWAAVGCSSRNWRLV